MSPSSSAPVSAASTARKDSHLTDIDDSDGERCAKIALGPVPEWREELTIDCICETQNQRHKYKCQTCGKGQHIACYYGYRTRRPEFIHAKWDTFDPRFTHSCIKCKPNQNLFLTPKEAGKRQRADLKKKRARLTVAPKAPGKLVYCCVCKYDTQDGLGDQTLCGNCGTMQHASCFDPNWSKKRHFCHRCGGRPLSVEVAKKAQRSIRGIPEPVARPVAGKTQGAKQSTGHEEATSSSGAGPVEDHRSEEEVCGVTEQAVSKESQPEWVAVSKSGKILPNPFLYKHVEPTPPPSIISEPIAISQPLKRKWELQSTIRVTAPEEMEMPRPKKVCRLKKVYGTTAQMVGLERMRTRDSGKGRVSRRARRPIIGRSRGEPMQPRDVEKKPKNRGDPVETSTGPTGGRDPVVARVFELGQCQDVPQEVFCYYAAKALGQYNVPYNELTVFWDPIIAAFVGYGPPVVVSSGPGLGPAIVISSASSISAHLIGSPASSTGSSFIGFPAFSVGSPLVGSPASNVSSPASNVSSPASSVGSPVSSVGSSFVGSPASSIGSSFVGSPASSVRSPAFAHRHEPQGAPDSPLDHGYQPCSPVRAPAPVSRLGRDNDDGCRPEPPASRRERY